MTAKYGASETNGLNDLDISPEQWRKHLESMSDEKVEWNDERLARITRLRLLSDPGFPWWDVSYCHGQLKDGTNVQVDLPFSQLPKRGMRKAILEHAKRDGVYAKGLGVFDNISTLI
jgi:hypothetical protein